MYNFMVTGKNDSDVVKSLKAHLALFGKNGKVEETDDEEDDTADAEDDEDDEVAPKSSKASKAKVSKKAAAVDEDDEDDTAEDDEDEDEDEDDEDEVAPKSAKGKKVTSTMVNAACKTRAADTGGKKGRQEVLKILKSKFDVDSVAELEPSQYAAVIKAMAV